MKINLNNSVTVVLTSTGMEIFTKHPRSTVASNDLEKNTLTVTLWELFNIFGDEMMNGAPIVFEDNSLFLEDSSVEMPKCVYWDEKNGKCTRTKK